MRTMKHWALAVMTAAALALAGCGGGSSPPQASGPTPAEQEYMAVGNAITAAETAVDGLTATSMDADVAAAQTAVDAARTALNGADLLSANQAVALNTRLLAIENDFDTVQEDIAAHRGTMDDQRMMANNAINEAMMAVNDLSDSSTDADVQAAKDKIQVAKDAVAAATTLSMSDRAALNARITPIETMLASTESDINEYRLAMGAGDAVDAAHTAVAGLTNASSDADVQAAKDAIQAAKDAVDAANAASALTAAEATAHSRRIAMIESTLTTTETAIAAYRQQEADDAETQRVADVADARSRAMQSYMDADADATKAEAAATEAETTAPGSQGAMDARAAAMAARMAANAAKMAHDAITDGMTKEQADAQATEAANQAGTASSSYMTAKAENDDIQTNAATIAENQRQQDVADARTYGGMAVDNAKAAADDARAAANAAKMAADDAMDEYERAMSARTNATEAKKKADAALAAYMAADMAANDANTAYMAAKAAIDGVMDNSSSEVANTARSTAETQENLADGHKSTAETQQMTAETERDNATKYANMHVVGLLMAANAVHITSASDPDANRDETELDLIERNRLAHVKAVNTAVSTANADNPVADSPTAPFHGGGTATASWHYYGELGADSIISNAAAVTSDAANADTKPGEGLPAFGVTAEGGTVLNLVRAGPGTDGQAGTDDDVAANFGGGPGLGAFSHELYLDRYNDADTSSTVNTGDSYNRIILFSDLTQAKATVPAESVSLTNEPVSMAARVTPTAAPATTGDDIHDFAGTYDHDGNPDTDAIAGTFDCVDPTTCRVTRSGTGNGGEHVTGQTKVTSISGYRFTGTGTTAEVLSMLDDTWLAFGVWLTETVADGTNTYVFGAFADGGAAIGDTGEPAAVASVTGDATYTGKAAGVHSTATEVEFFHADAMLNAKFGDGTDIGTITGMIHNIMSGGREVTGGSIELVVSDPGAATPSPNIVDAGTFSGRARMGNTGMQDSSGEDIYRYTGGWSGTFYNHMADNTNTADVDESTRAPGSIAGTFGVGRADVASTMDVDETESYVGAFGAHCSGSNCNPHD